MDTFNTQKQRLSIGQLARCAVLMVVVGLVGCGGASSESGGSGTPVGVGAVDVDANGTASLSWVAPSTRVDNSPLPMSEIGGYKVYMGVDANALALYEDISDPYQMELVVSDLDAGTYYFAVTAYNQYGAESDFSEVVDKAI